MDEPQIIKTPGGEELVVLSRKEYDALIGALAEAEEELADIAVLDQRLAELEGRGRNELPEEVSAMLLDGQTLLRALMKWRSLSFDDLVARSGLDRGAVGLIESAEQRPTAEQAERLAKSLQIPPTWLD